MWLESLISSLVRSSHSIQSARAEILSPSLPSYDTSAICASSSDTFTPKIDAYGPIIRYFFPFGAERLSIAENEALKHMSVRSPYNYPRPVRAKLWMIRILGEGVLLAEGHEHVHQRKALAPGFSIQSIHPLTPIFWEKPLLLANCWRHKMCADVVSTKSLEALDWLNRTTLDIIGKAGFGYDVNSLENPDAPMREAYRLCSSFDIVSRILIGLQPGATRDIMQSRSIILGKATGIIEEKQEEAANNAGGKDILPLIALDNKKPNEASEAGLSFETMRDQAMTFLGAGHAQRLHDLPAGPARVYWAQLQRDFDTPDPEDWKMWTLVLRPRDGVTLRVTAI
ncbi:hypothetical protein CTA2_5400 [Colletotrichum tanaceti]|nr:hypothetical protein CTA2_5400 [Colletotrichum tanaceti]